MPRLLILFFVILLGMAPSMRSQKMAGVISTVTLAEMRDRVRPLLIFAPDTDDARLVEQVHQMSAHAAEAADRALVTVAVPERGSFLGEHLLTERDAIEARKRFHIEAGEFVVVLIGKDGEEKLRARKPLSFQKLQETIDAMPMRQEEMKVKGR